MSECIGNKIKSKSAYKNLLGCQLSLDWRRQENFNLHVDIIRAVRCG